MTTTQTEEPAATTAPETDETPAGPGLMKALESERELHKAEHKRANAAEARATEAESRAEQLAGKLTTTETERDEARTKITEITSARVHDLRVQVATDAGLDPRIAPRLTGSTREELEADAKLFASAVGSGGFDGGARKPAPMKTDPAKAHGRFIADLMNGGDGTDLQEDN